MTMLGIAHVAQAESFCKMFQAFCRFPTAYENIDLSGLHNAEDLTALTCMRRSAGPYLLPKANMDSIFLLPDIFPDRLCVK